MFRVGLSNNTGPEFWMVIETDECVHSCIIVREIGNSASYESVKSFLDLIMIFFVTVG